MSPPSNANPGTPIGYIGQPVYSYSPGFQTNRKERPQELDTIKTLLLGVMLLVHILQDVHEHYGYYYMNWSAIHGNVLVDIFLWEYLIAQFAAVYMENLLACKIIYFFSFLDDVLTLITLIMVFSLGSVSSIIMASFFMRATKTLLLYMFIALIKE